MATIDQQFVEYIVKTLVNNPDKVAVERKIDEKGVAIRVLLRALGTKQDARYNLKIVNTDDDGGAKAAKTEVVEEVSEEVEETEEPEGETSELAEKTRAELADLDDLDI